MKLYVIKRNDGYYMMKSGWFETEDLNQAETFSSKEDAERNCITCDGQEVVECTLTETKELKEVEYVNRD